VQLGLWVPKSCGLMALVRAVVCRHDGPRRWCWWSSGHGRVAGCWGGGPEAFVRVEDSSEDWFLLSLFECRVPTPPIIFMTSSLRQRCWTILSGSSVVSSLPGVGWA
jgi:hypothetical protein